MHVLCWHAELDILEHCEFVLSFPFLIPHNSMLINVHVSSVLVSIL